MTIYSNFIVFPEGDMQEIEHSLKIGQLVDINGVPLPLPLKTSKMIAYRVSKKSTKETRGEVNCYYYLEQLTRNELEGFVNNF